MPDFIANRQEVKGIKIGTLRSYQQLPSGPDPDTLYFITDKGLIIRGSSIVVPLNYTTYNLQHGIDNTHQQNEQVAFTVETYTDPGREPEVLEFTVCTRQAVLAIAATIEQSLETHAGVSATAETLGHVTLSDRTDGEEDVDDGVAATPSAVSAALLEAKTYAESLLGQAAGAMVLKGTIGSLADGADVTELPINPRVGWTYIVVTAGTYSDIACTVGDELVCTAVEHSVTWKRVHTEANPNAVTASANLTTNQLIVGAGNRTAKILAAGQNGDVLEMSGGKPQWVTPSNARRGIAFGTCNTAELDGTKEVSIHGFQLVAGATVTVRFTYPVGAESTLNVNSTGDNEIIHHGDNIAAGVINRGTVATFVLEEDGGRRFWVLTALDSTIGGSLSQFDNDIAGYGTCNTAASTPMKLVAIPGFTLVAGAVVAVLFNYDVISGATLNVNRTGAYNIKHRGVNITDTAIYGGDTAHFIFSGTAWHLLGTDRPFETAPRAGSHNMVDSDAVYQCVESAKLYWEEM